MNDAELDEFERAMDAWEVDHTPARMPMMSSSKFTSAPTASHHRLSTTPPPPLVKTEGRIESAAELHDGVDELAGYVKRQQARGPVQQDSSGTAHQRNVQLRAGHVRRHQPRQEPPKSYGYQEPTLFERRRPQPRLPPLEERHRAGGWNHSTLVDEEVAQAAAGRRSVPLLTNRPPAGHPLTRQPRSAGAAPATSGKNVKKLPQYLSPLADRSGADSDAAGVTTRATNSAQSHDAALDASKVALLPTEADNVIVVVPHPVAATLQAAITATMQELSDRKAEKAAMQRRILGIDEDRLQKSTGLQAKKAELVQLEKRANRAKDIKRELGQLIAQQRSKEHQLADIKNMLRHCLKRLQDAKLLASFPSAGAHSELQDDVLPALVPASSAAGPPPTLPKLTIPGDAVDDPAGANPSRAIASLKLKWGKLNAEQAALTTEKARLASKVTKGAAKQAAEIAKLSKQRAAITKELERRSKVEFEAARQHMTQNHDKGMAHRSREQSHTMDNEQTRHRDLVTRVKDVQEQLKTQSKLIHELASRESALRIQARDAEQRCTDAEHAIGAERRALQETIEAKEGLLKKLDGIAYERQLLTDKLSDPKKIAEVQRAHEDERRSMMSAVTDAQQAQLRLVQRVADLERQLSDGSLMVRHRFITDASKPLHKSIPELRLRIQQYKEEHQRLAQLTEDTRAETESKKRDAAKNRKLKDQQQDRAIEQLTKDLASCKEMSKACTKDNHQLESALDTAERMISMNNLRHT